MPWIDAILRLTSATTRPHVGDWQRTRARYLGRRKNLFDLRRVAVVHNPHLIDRRPDVADRQPPPARQAA